LTYFHAGVIGDPDSPRPDAAIGSWRGGSRVAIPYFAFGSNMLLERIKKRVPSARALGIATLGGYALRFNKLSKDGSSKANIVPSADPRAVVYGVLYHLDEDERPRLDRAEGLGKGYQIRRVRVRRDGAEVEEEAFTYIAAPEAVRDDLPPFRWYKDMVIAGATRNRLPEPYLRQIEAVEAVDDPGR
jgi:gamma-glutamylcyclotransferase